MKRLAAAMSMCRVLRQAGRSKQSRASCSLVTQSPCIGAHNFAADVAINLTVKWRVNRFKEFFAILDPSAVVEMTPKGVQYNGELVMIETFVNGRSFDSATEVLMWATSDTFCGAMAHADIMDFEVHGPQSELDELREPLKEVIKAPVVYWVKVDGAFYVPEKTLAVESVKQAANSNVSVKVYWDITDYLEFIKGVYEFQELTKQETEIRYYGFAMTDDTAVCKEGYDSAQGFLTHLDNVKVPFQAALRSAVVSHIDIDGPKAEIDKLRRPLKDFKANFYSPLFEQNIFCLETKLFEQSCK
jgi:hypothetical protein